MTENWLTWYLGGADSKSRLSFLKFQPKNPFLGKFGPKKSKLSVLSENWHTRYLKDADSYFNINFLKFQPQNSFLGKFRPKKLKSSVLFENWHTWYLEDANPYSKISFYEFPTLNSLLGKYWPKKSKLSFCLKIGSHGISRMLIVISTFAFWISNHKKNFWASFWALPENWHTWYFEGVDSYSEISFLNFKT